MNSKVAIIGAGTAGLTASLLFNKLGWDVTIFEKLVEPIQGTRAPTLWKPAQNILKLVNAYNNIKEKSFEITKLKFQQNHNVIKEINLDEDDCITLSQFEIIEELRRVVSREPIKMRYGHRVLSVHADESTGFIDVICENSEKQKINFSNFCLVIGADGARSTVQKHIGQKLCDLSPKIEFSLVDIKVASTTLDPNTVTTLSSPDGTYAFVPLPSGVLRCVGPQTADYHQVIPAIQRLGIDVPTDSEIIWHSDFTARSSICSSFADGRIALIGDAAHLQTPAGGRGMNNGIEDAFTLASFIGKPSTHVLSPNLEKSIIHYSALRHAEITDELNVNRVQTIQWVEGVATNPSATSSRSESQIHRCIYPRFLSTNSLTTSPAANMYLGVRRAEPSIIKNWGKGSFAMQLGLSTQNQLYYYFPEIQEKPSELPSGIYIFSPTLEIIGYISAWRLAITPIEILHQHVDEIIKRGNHKL